MMSFETNFFWRLGHSHRTRKVALGNYEGQSETLITDNKKLKLYLHNI